VKRQKHINKAEDGSAYWGFYSKGGSFSDSEGASEPADANPNVLAEGFNPWKRELTDEQEDLLSVYYRAVDAGVLRKLTQKEREVWKLVFFRKMSENEAAAKMGTSRSSIRTWIKRAGEKIHQQIKEQGSWKK
jgi:RNA polymerase sigma factor (sigma-70 family)